MAGREGKEVRLSNEQFREVMSRPAMRARNGDVAAPALPAPVTEHTKRRSLEASVQREAPSGERFEIVFTIYAFQPCDWDNWHVKELQDMVVEAGILPSDSWDTLSGRVVSKKAETKEEEKTIIEITHL